MGKPHFVCVIGTRPEAIKMAPVIKCLKKNMRIKTSVLVTEQHKEMLNPVLQFFNITADVRNDVMRSGQNLAELTETLLHNTYESIRDLQPGLVLVQGDTTTTMAASLASFYLQIPVAHIEAGLRTGSLASPWPEEANRKITSIFSKFHFAPTERAKKALLNEGVDSDSVWVTGNTVIDALFMAESLIDKDPALRKTISNQVPAKENGKYRILVTSHRRENHESGIENLCNAIKELSKRDNIEFIFPVHLNPVVQAIVKPALSGLPNVRLLDPLDYPSFVVAMRSADIILTDSGGIQEEAPSMATPVLVLRNHSERPEAIEAGTAKLIGMDTEKIISNVLCLIENKTEYKNMAKKANPYGDGNAAHRIVNVLGDFFKV